MRVYEVVTASGTVYEIAADRTWWRRNGGEWHKTWEFKSAVDPDSLPWSDVTHDWSDVTHDWSDTSVPKVGTRLYLADKDSWYISTEVVSVKRERVKRDD